MQNIIVLAFRKRLKKRGYTDVSICKVKGSDRYLVSGLEPLSGLRVSREFDLFELNGGFRF